MNRIYIGRFERTANGDAFRARRRACCVCRGSEDYKETRQHENDTNHRTRRIAPTLTSLSLPSGELTCVWEEKTFAKCVTTHADPFRPGRESPRKAMPLRCSHNGTLVGVARLCRNRNALFRSNHIGTQETAACTRLGGGDARPEIVPRSLRQSAVGHFICSCVQTLHALWYEVFAR